jgi:hypothetical protein
MSIKSLDELNSIKAPEPSEAYIMPGINHSLLVWLVLLGMPALLLFLIFEKSQHLETLDTTVSPSAVHAPAR